MLYQFSRGDFLEGRGGALLGHPSEVLKPEK